MTDDQHRPVSDRLHAILTILARDPDDDFTARRLAAEADIPLGTISGLVDRGSAYGWVISRRESGARLYQINRAALQEVCDVLGIPVPVPVERRVPPPRPAVRPADRFIDYGPPRTLAQLIEEEPRPIVESVCRQLGWPSPFEDPRPTKRGRKERT